MDQFIRLYPNLIPPALCRSIIDRFDADPRRHAGRVEGDAAAAKRSTDLEIGEHPDWAPLCRELDGPMAASLRLYRKDVPNFAQTQRGVLRESGYQVQRYLPGGEERFDWHADVAARDNAERCLAMIAYLNTVAEGGETQFRAQDLSVAPREGAILWFPPTFPYVHRGNPPKGGAKYVITCFLRYPR